MADRLAAVTGATGFLGQHIVSALTAAGWKVRILTRKSPDCASADIVIGDIQDRGAVRALVDGADVVVHAAGLIKAPSCGAFRAVNAGGAANLVGALDDCAPGKHVVMVSSMAAREPQLSNYAATKREGEDVLAAQHAHDWTIVRPCAVYGPGDRETLAIFQAAVRRIVPRPGPRSGRVALIHVVDAANAIASLCEARLSRRLFELTDRRVQGYAWPEIVSAAEAAIGTKVLTVPLPGFVVRAAGAVNMLTAKLSGRTPIFTPGKAREILHADWGSSPDRQPPPDIWTATIELGDGFRDTVSWYRDRHWLPVAANG